MTNTYEYGNGRIAQNNSGGGANYFLGDALGSVRQLTDSSGNVTLTKSYEPYGDVLSTSGSGSSSYGFTGEWMDNTGLVYLRARYYAPGVGRFISKDTWAGEYLRPLTLNGWLYTKANPINRVDPSGHCSVGGHWMPEDSAACKWRPNKLTLSQAVTASLDAYCFKHQGACTAGKVSKLWVNLKFMESICVRSKYKMGETEFVSLPYHNDFLTKEDKYGGNYYYSHPDELFPWEGVANVAFAENGDLHPLRYVPGSADASYFADHWIGDTAGIIQTTINKLGCNHKYTSANDVALTPGQYRGANEYTLMENKQYRGRSIRYPDFHDDPVYKEFYGLAFVVVQLRVRVNQPYCYFAHQDLNSIRGNNPLNINDTNHTERVGFNWYAGDHHFYITKIYPYLPSNFWNQ